MDHETNKLMMTHCACRKAGEQPTNDRQVPDKLTSEGMKTVTTEGHFYRTVEHVPLTKDAPDGRVGEG